MQPPGGCRPAKAVLMIFDLGSEAMPQRCDHDAMLQALALTISMLKIAQQEKP